MKKEIHLYYETDIRNAYISSISSYFAKSEEGIYIKDLPKMEVISRYDLYLEDQQVDPDNLEVWVEYYRSADGKMNIWFNSYYEPLTMIEER